MKNVITLGTVHTHTHTHTSSNLIDNNRVEINYSYCDIKNRLLYNV